MEIKIIRKYKKAKYTIGIVYVNGEYFCNSLEDVDRGLSSDMSVDDILKVKKPKETAIPCGRYRITLSYSPKFHNKPYAISGMIPLINGVKGFSAIRMHDGKDESWTDGCILMGRNTKVGQLTDGLAVMTELTKRVSTALFKGESVYVTII